MYSHCMYMHVHVQSLHVHVHAVTVHVYAPENYYTAISVSDEKLVAFFVPRDFVHLKSAAATSLDELCTLSTSLTSYLNCSSILTFELRTSTKVKRSTFGG